LSNTPSNPLIYCFEVVSGAKSKKTEKIFAENFTRKDDKKQLFSKNKK
jgi:hypothetical protein